MTKTEQQQPSLSHSGSQSPRERNHGSFSISSSNKDTCAFGSTTKSCAWTTRIQKLNDSARVYRSFRIASRSLGKIARDWSKQLRPLCALAKDVSLSFRWKKHRTSKQSAISNQQSSIVNRQSKNFPFQPVGTVPGAIWIFVRQRSAFSVLIIRLGHVRTAAASAERSRSI